MTWIVLALCAGGALGFYVAWRFHFLPKIANLTEKLESSRLKVKQLEAKIQVKDMTIADKSKALGNGGGPASGGTGPLRSVH